MMTRWAIRDGGVGRAAFCACLMLLALRAVAQPDPPGTTETELVIQAHQEVTSAVVEVRYGVYFTRIEETEFVTSQYRLVFDRPTNRLRIDRPGYTLLSDGSDILLVAEALPGRHLRMPLDNALTYDRLAEVFPDLSNPTAPALLYLFDDDPAAHFSDGQAKDASALQPGHPSEEDQIHLTHPLDQGRHQHSFNGESRLVEQVLIDLDVKRQDFEAARFHYTFDWSDVDESVDDAEFELDLKQSHEMTTLATFLSPSGGNAQPGPGGQGGGVAAGGSLIGMPLPELELDVLGGDKKVKLSELDKGVVVLECFATWSKTSVLDLPALADFQAWCKGKKHSVQVFGIAVGEQPEHLGKWIEALEKTAKKEVGYPMLLDISTNAAAALKIPTVPRTLIVVDGRIVDVYGGVKPTYLDDLKEGMPGWLEKVKEPDADPEPKAE